MAYPSTPLSYPRNAEGRRPRGRRAAVWGGVLAAAAATVFSVGTPAPAATGAHPDVAAAPGWVKTQGKARVTAAVLDLDGSGRKPLVYGADVRYDTASIIKVDILATALLQAQDAGHGLTAEQRAEAEVMIERSDNTAANALWRQIGLAPGLEAANKRLGLTSTHGGPGAKWGLTRTTASDQIRLLRAVFGTGTVAQGGSKALDQASRTYIRTLMNRIAGEQAWGVSAAADSGWALKNGWLQRATTGLWDVNSVGRIAVGKHHYLVAVLSDGNTSMKDGVALVERAARTAIASATAG
ncbi:serine hydrolase [Streptomyces sp. NPDC005209]|uniref:serine hydrolase n=1 Tax=Streptomyces sp. NPDC005209 TaxID=3156715 RepID=UPI0033AFED0F